MNSPKLVGLCWCVSVLECANGMREADCNGREWLPNKGHGRYYGRASTPVGGGTGNTGYFGLPLAIGLFDAVGAALAVFIIVGLVILIFSAYRGILMFDMGYNLKP